MKTGKITLWVIVMEHNMGYVTRVFYHNATADFKNMPEYVKTEKVEIILPRGSK